MYAWQKQVETAIAHLRKWRGWQYQTKIIGEQMFIAPRVMVHRGGATYAPSQVSVDASMADVTGVQAAFAFARKWADGWATITVATRNSFVIFANGQMVDRNRA